jgi:hypothetical protein
MAVTGPSRKMVVTGAAIEIAVVYKVKNDHGIVSEPFHEGRPGRCCGRPRRAPLRARHSPCWPGGTRLGAVASGTLLAAGSLLTRFGVFEAGMASARDPKYTVIPQRERMAAGEKAHAPTPDGHAPTVTR